jgi:predicted anti-sigma-YlaC factor YlaD
MRHLSRGERLALIESPDGAAHPHLQACARCRAEVDNARAVMLEARLVRVPEPSPLFWDHLTARVSAQIVAEPTAPRRSRMAWRVLVPLAVGVTALVLAVVIDRGPIPRAALGRSATAAGPAVLAPGTDADDASWSLLGEMAGEFDVDTLSDSIGTSESTGVQDAVYQLSAEERVNLAELLRAETGPEHPEQ